ncbi:hypothetical protein D3C80_1225900 [compost metagenome]
MGSLLLPGVQATTRVPFERVDCVDDGDSVGLAWQVDKYAIELPTKTVERTVDKVGVGSCRPSWAVVRAVCVFFDQPYFYR